MKSHPARRSSSTDGNEAVADAERVRGDRLLGAGDRPPGGVDGRVDDLLHAAVALGADDDAAVAERHASRAAAALR